MDFIWGVLFLEGGKFIIVLFFVINKGISCIICMLKFGVGVVMICVYVYYIVMEYGVVEMFGCNFW